MKHSYSPLSVLIHCYSILSVMIYLLQLTVSYDTFLQHTVSYDTLLQHTVSNDISVTAYCQLCYICNSPLSVMIHCYSILPIMIYLLQLTVSYATFVTAHSQL